ncbi:MAG: hypothetical protein M1839_002719 [Geoglossum umbratile]|nr:MAG: hypothetical protein M1839_002719 [Geoglossum umbratile]
MAGNSNLKSHLDKVMISFEIVDRHVMHSRFIRKEIFNFPGDQVPTPFDYSDPKAYLEDDDLIYYWDKYFEHLIQEWDLYQDSERLSEARYNSIVERLSMPAATLDQYAPRLVKEYREMLNIPERLVQGILKRRTALNTFLNSADIGLYHWWKHAGITEDRTLRRRRPMPHIDGEESPGTTSVVEKLAAIDPNPDMSGAASHPSNNAFTGRVLWSVHSVLLVGQSCFHQNYSSLSIAQSNATLIALTSLITLIAAMLESRAFSLSVSQKGLSPGKISDPDFYATLQNSIMQLLSLYVTVLPALRHQEARRSYRWWTWILAVGSFACAAAAAVCYIYAATVAPLIGFLGSALQAFIVLQLIWILDDGFRKHVKEEKEIPNKWHISLHPIPTHGMVIFPVNPYCQFIHIEPLPPSSRELRESSGISDSIELMNLITACLLMKAFVKNFDDHSMPPVGRPRSWAMTNAGSASGVEAALKNLGVKKPSCKVLVANDNERVLAEQVWDRFQGASEWGNGSGVLGAPWLVGSLPSMAAAARLAGAKDPHHDSRCVML